MLTSALDEEINDLEQYAAFIQSWSRTGQTSVQITTLEDAVLRVNLSDDGWDLQDSTTAAYPTVEALLMDKSPRFEELWNQELVHKLEELKEKDEHVVL